MSILLFTSGTTSKSKAVMLNQNGIATNIYDMQLVETFYSTDVNIAFCHIIIFWINWYACNVSFWHENSIS